MLINKMGTEPDDEVVHLDDHRPAADPRNRETMTTLLQSALSTVPRSALLPTAPAPVTTLETTLESSADAASDVA
jgi:hypothetical protein